LHTVTQKNTGILHRPDAWYNDDAYIIEFSNYSVVSKRQEFGKLFITLIRVKAGYFMTNLSLDCDQIESALQLLEADINASEIHGTLCALLCADSANTGQMWFENLVPAAESLADQESEATQTLNQLCEETRLNLNDPTCEFELLLPADQEDIQTRTTALADWCQGFIMGLMMCGLKDFHKLPENSAEVSQDIMEISRAGSSYNLEESTEDENALEELIEYVRVGVLLINEELNPERKPANSGIDYTKLH